MPDRRRRSTCWRPTSGACRNEPPTAPPHERCTRVQRIATPRKRASRSCPRRQRPSESLYEAQRRSIRARCTAGSRAGAGRWSWLTQLVFYGLPWLQWNGRQAVLFDLARAQVLHLRPGAVAAGLHLPRRRCWSSRRCRCSSSPRWPGGCGAATPARRRSTPRSSCGSSARSKATACARMRLDAGAVDAATSWRARRPSTRCGSRSRCGPASPSSATSRRSATLAREVAARSRWARGRRSGCCSTASPPTATPASCASRCASTCARTRASRARCSTATR